MSDQGLSIILGTSLGLLGLLLLYCIFASWRRQATSEHTPQKAESGESRTTGATGKNPFANVVPYVTTSRHKPQGYHRAQLDDDDEMVQSATSPGFRNPFVNAGGNVTQRDRYVPSRVAAANARAAGINDLGTGAAGQAASLQSSTTANPVSSQ
jgi:hypothetical protein